MVKSTFTYEGNFKDNVMEGEGRYVYSNGDAYRGAFVKGKFQGQGVYTFANGDPPIEGRFENGRPVD